MAGTFVVNAGNTSISFTFTQPTAKAQAIIGAAGHYLFDAANPPASPDNPNPVLFASLTNQQKLDLVDAHLKRVIMDLARTYQANTAAKTATATAVADAAANLNL